MSVYASADAPVKSLALIVKVEDGLWMALLGGYEGLFPPKQDAELHDFAKKVCMCLTCTVSRPCILESAMQYRSINRSG